MAILRTNMQGRKVNASKNEGFKNNVQLLVICLFFEFFIVTSLAYIAHKQHMCCHTPLHGETTKKKKTTLPTDIKNSHHLQGIDAGNAKLELRKIDANKNHKHCKC
jgi:hypothetical protein